MWMLALYMSERITVKDEFARFSEFWAARVVATLIGQDERALLSLFSLAEEGVAFASRTHVRNRFAVRVANINHRSTRAELHVLVDETIPIAAGLLGNG